MTSFVDRVDGNPCTRTGNAVQSRRAEAESEAEERLYRPNGCGSMLGSRTHRGRSHSPVRFRILQPLALISGWRFYCLWCLICAQSVHTVRLCCGAEYELGMSSRVSRLDWYPHALRNCLRLVLDIVNFIN